MCLGTWCDAASVSKSVLCLLLLFVAVLLLKLKHIQEKIDLDESI